MASEAFTLALLLTLKDSASGGLDRFEAKLRTVGRTGEAELAKLDKLRSDLNKDLAIGGAGLAGLKVLKEGVQVAADYQSVMTDLRASIAQTGTDGKVNYNLLAQEMVEAEAVAVRLGNKLPGTTADFAQMMQTMKQNGLDVKTIVGGAADAVGNLAVASNAVPKEIAADFARFGNLFKLNPEDFTPAADVFSRIYSSTGQTSAELIEATKYFQGRVGQSLQIGGLKDAEKYTRLFGFLGKQGMTGSMAGMGLTNFFNAYNTHRDKLKDLEKSTGIKLDFFDKQGKFVGLDSVMEQMSQFDKLSAKDRTQWMETMFGTLGAGVGNVMIDTKGWKAFNEEQNKTISLQDKTAMKAQNYNNQMEALEGTLTNLKVAVFEPMLPAATAIVDKANQLAGILQGFAKSHPDIAKYAVAFLGIGSAALVAYSGVKTLTTGVRLFKMTSTFARGEGLAGSLAQASTATERLTKNQAGFVRQNNVVQSGMVRTGDAARTATHGVNGLATSVAIADSKTVRLRKNLFSLDNVFKAVLVIEAIGFTWDQIAELRKTLTVSKDQNVGANAVSKDQYNLYRNTPADQRNPQAEAASTSSMLQMGSKQVEKSLDQSRKNFVDLGADFGKLLMGVDTNGGMFEQPVAPGNPLLARRQERLDYHQSQPTRSGKWGWAETATAAMLPLSIPLLLASRISPDNLADRDIRGANYLQQRAPSLADPQVMSEFRTREMPKMNLDPQMKADMDNMLKLAFPESFAQSMTGMFDQGSQAFVQAMSSLQQPIAGTAELFSGLPPAITPVGQSFATLPQPIIDSATALTTLPQPINETTGALGNLLTPAGRIPGSFNNVFTSANNLSTSLDGVTAKIANWQPPAASSIAGPVAAPPSSGRPQPSIPSIFGMPGRAVGGVVERDGVAYVHAGNVITPARATRGISGFSDLMALARTGGNTVSSSNRSFQSITNILRSGMVSERSDVQRIIESAFDRGTTGSNSFIFPSQPPRSGDAATQSFAGLPNTLSGQSPEPLKLVLTASPSATKSRSANPLAGLPFPTITAGDAGRDGNKFSSFDSIDRSEERLNSVSSFMTAKSTDNRQSTTSSQDHVTSRTFESQSRDKDTSQSLTSLVDRVIDHRSEASRFRFDDELFREADRSTARPQVASKDSVSPGPNITVNAPFTFSPTITAKTVGAVEEQMDRQYAAAKKQMLRQVAKKLDEGRLRA